MKASTTRREFLKTTAAATFAVAAAGTATSETRDGAAGSAGSAGSETGDDAKPSPEEARKPTPPSIVAPGRLGGWAKETVILDKPHVVTPHSPFLNASGEIANKRFVLNPKFIGPNGFPTGTLPKPAGVKESLSAFGMLTLPPGSRNIRIVDCEFEGPWRSLAAIPQSKPGNPRHMRGIDMQYCSDIRIEGCSFDYMPAEAIYFYACVGIEVQDVWSTNCTNIVRADWMGVPRSRLIHLNRLHHADGWGIADPVKDPSYASTYESGRMIGGNAVVGYFVDSQISNVTTSGEVKSGMKLVCPIRVELDRIYTSNLMIQGTMYWNKTNDPTKGNGRVGAYNQVHFDETPGDHAVDVLVTRSRVRPEQNAWARGLARNGVQLSYHQEKIRFRDCVFYKPNQSKHDYQGIQAWDGVEADIRDCLFVGWNKPRDPLPAYPGQSILRTGTYGKKGSRPVSINSDFVRVNQFRR